MLSPDDSHTVIDRMLAAGYNPNAFVVWVGPSTCSLGNSRSLRFELLSLLLFRRLRRTFALRWHSSAVCDPKLDIVAPRSPPSRHVANSLGTDYKRFRDLAPWQAAGILFPNAYDPSLDYKDQLFGDSRGFYDAFVAGGARKNQSTYHSQFAQSVASQTQRT